ncbi:MAG TPA: hypothetical protein VM940_14640 [Chthoniobacterales bacterium]|jgi:photosystem II stability/assembly factor-like uncharacterized protein|nr:hypothetical protein [Chthoniobacterales bacterium]
MKRSAYIILGTLAVVLAAAALLPLASDHKPQPARAHEEIRHREHEREKTPPEDAFISQRVVHGGIPAGALEKARAQANRINAATRSAAAQPDGQSATPAWQFVGPTNIGGRIVDIAVDPVAADTIYVAAATGGIWKSTDKGAHFTPAWPADFPQSMGALVITSTGTLFAGLGEANPGGGSITYGGSGVYRSVDRGVTWQHVGLTSSGAIGRIAVDPSDPQHIFVAAAGDLFNPGGERGVYETTDGGATWIGVLNGDNDTTGAVDLAIDPSNPNRVFAAMWDHRRQPNLRRYGGVGSGLYRTTDGGTNWQRLTNGFPGSAATIGRIGVALAASNPQRVYAIVNQTNGLFQGFYRSDNGGDSWTNVPADTKLADAQASFGWWFGKLWVDPANQARVFAAGVALCESQDSGATFIEHLSPHADHHALVWDPKAPGRVYLGNDGGTYRSDVNGSNDQWTKAVSEPYTQFYSVDVSEQDEARLVGGAQDNGVNRSFGGVSWNSYVGGDGLAALINPVDQNLVYGCFQYGNCYRSTDAGATTTYFTPAIGAGGRRNWFAPLVFQPNDPAILYFGGTRVHRSTNHAVSWSAISPDLTGGPGPDPSYPFGTVTTVAAAKADPNRLLAGTDDGRLWFTTNLGATWTQVTDPDLPGTWVTRVAFDPLNPAVAYATFSGFRSGTALPYVLKTTDGGTNWSSIASDLPQAPVNDIVIVGSNLYVASDVGVFASADGGATWVAAGGDLPNVPVTDLEYRAASNSIFAATFGRGIYRLGLAPAHALNIATRLRVETGAGVMIGGFIITGTTPKSVALRGLGPSLQNSGLTDVLTDPTLELRASGGGLLAQNDNWQDDPGQETQLIVLGLAPQNPKESGIVTSLPSAGSYTAILAGKNGGTGVGLVEIYDVSQPTGATDAQLANISTRGLVQTGSNVMIGGFILGGGDNAQVALRGIGPSLGQFGLSPLLADPTLELHDSNGALLISNDDWQSDPTSAAQLSLRGLAPGNEKESGIFASLPPGAFTAVLAGKNGGTGIGLVEIYNVQ